MILRRAFLNGLALLGTSFLLVTAGCRTQSNASVPEQDPARVATEKVRALMQSVAHDVTEQGPMAWCNYFESGPVFFMAVNGQMAFPNGAAAKEGTENFAHTIKRIELQWGDDLRVDPLTPEFAVVAAPWREIQVDLSGHRTEETGFFTALVEYQDGRWRFRNAHWSSPVPPVPAH